MMQSVLASRPELIMLEILPTMLCYAALLQNFPYYAQIMLKLIVAIDC